MRAGGSGGSGVGASIVAHPLWWGAAWSAVFAALAIVAVLSSLRPAEACSGGTCSTGSFVPASGDVPANLPAVLWWPRAGVTGLPDPTAVGLFRVTSGGEVAVTVTSEQQQTGAVVVRPASPLDPDTDYVVRGANTCDGSGKVDATATQASFHTGATSPFPTTPGTLTLGAATVGQLQVSTVSGGCSTFITAAQSTITLTPSADATPWQGALQYTVLVDGNEWREYDSLRGGPPVGGGTFGVVYALCAYGDDQGADPGVKPGQHSVVIRATMAGWSTSIETAPI